MKNFLITLSILLIISGCSSIQLTEVKTSETEAKRILAMGLSHEENLILAKKVSDPDLILGVISRLKKFESEKNSALLEANNIVKYEELIKVLGPDESGQISYKAPLVFGSSNSSLFNNQKDSYSYFLNGFQDKNGLNSHQLQISIEYIAKNYRNYASVYFCDKWRCNELTKIDLRVLTTSANNCVSAGCQYTEIFSFDLSDLELTDNISSGLFIQLNSDNESNKIQISSSYIKAILRAIS